MTDVFVSDKAVALKKGSNVMVFTREEFNSVVDAIKDYELTKGKNDEHSTM